MGKQVALAWLGITKMCCRSHFLTAVLPTIQRSTLELQRNTTVKTKAPRKAITVIKLNKRNSAGVMQPVRFGKKDRDTGEVTWVSS